MPRTLDVDVVTVTGDDGTPCSRRPRADPAAPAGARAGLRAGAVAGAGPGRDAARARPGRRPGRRAAGGRRRPASAGAAGPRRSAAGTAGCAARLAVLAGRVRSASWLGCVRSATAQLPPLAGALPLPLAVAGGRRGAAAPHAVRTGSTAPARLGRHGPGTAPAAASRPARAALVARGRPAQASAVVGGVYLGSHRLRGRRLWTTGHRDLRCSARHRCPSAGSLVVLAGAAGWRPSAGCRPRGRRPDAAVDGARPTVEPAGTRLHGHVIRVDPATVRASGTSDRAAQRGVQRLRGEHAEEPVAVEHRDPAGVLLQHRGERRLQRRVHRHPGLHPPAGVADRRRCRSSRSRRQPAVQVAPRRRGRRPSGRRPRRSTARGLGQPRRRACTTGGCSRSAVSMPVTASRLSPRSAPTKSATKSVAGAPSSVGRGVVLLEVAALAHHRDPVAEPHRLLDVVGDEDDRLAHALLQPQELLLQPVPRRSGRRRRTARPSAAPAGRRPARGPRRPAGAGRRRAGAGSGRRTSPGRGRPARAARRPGPRCAPCPSRAAAGTVATFGAMVWCGNRPTCWMT